MSLRVGSTGRPRRGALLSGGGGGGTGLPQAANLIEDWDARSITPQTDNTTLVGGWPGTKGVSGAATVGGAPKWRNGANGVGGIAGVQFNGGSDCLNYGQPAAIKAAIDSRNYTRINIFRTIGTPGFGCIASYGGNDTGSFDFADGAVAGRFGAAANGSNIPYAEQSTFGFLSVVPNISFALNSIPGVERVGLNGSTLASYVGASVSAGMGTGSMCFGNVVSGSGVPWTGVLTRSLIWNVVLTPTEVMQVYKVLAPIYGQTLKYSLRGDYKIFDGDSITSSVAVTTDITETFPWKAAQTMGLAVGQWSNLSIGGADFVNTLNVLAPTQINNLFSLIGKTLKICVGEWRNQQAADPTPRNNANAYVTLVRNANQKVCMWTSLSATDDPNANRNAYNLSWDTNSSNVDAYNATHTDTFIGVSGAATANPTYFADGVHTTALGCTEMNTKITPTFSAM